MLTTLVFIAVVAKLVPAIAPLVVGSDVLLGILLGRKVQPSSLCRFVPSTLSRSLELGRGDQGFLEHTVRRAQPGEMQMLRRYLEQRRVQVPERQSQATTTLSQGQPGRLPRPLDDVV